MTKTFKIPAGYRSKLDLLYTELAINEVKNHFESKLAKSLNLIKVTAPLLLKKNTGLNDNLNGVERTVSFDAFDLQNENVEIVQSLAKWKRAALSRYGLLIGQGIYTQMNAIRRDEELDNLHSIYVDQWDWEKVISKEERNLLTLKKEVKNIYEAIKATEKYMGELHSSLIPILPEDIHFISTQDLENRYPHHSPKEREDLIAKQFGAVFIMQIGGLLQSGEKHDGRSPDYDDWTLNGDIVLWNPVLDTAFEVSSMGIRVDEQALLYQLWQAGNNERKSLPYHQSVLNGKYPYTMGGGIGQSRLCMFLLKKVHIGEVQASVWDESILMECREKNIELL
ncbi:aspartate--ammonia ligase [Rossellomorea vietnamensis]|uniref:Aspartate--ammonia ligase n=1 Tax=Rossellomorea vietnamensis TaxID=218284 RepID=A0A5D4P1B9_9BACI|nr:aspartate--ammonia ligase [Rossellomorea vietnamensis]TYS18572.1 aspartate--ammonia ligase [Rossellomorea vietnamensis]